MSTGENWQIEVSIWTQVAASYLRYLAMAPQEAAAYETAFYVDNGRLQEWARKHIESIIERVNRLINAHNPDGHITVRNVDACSIARLAEMGLCGVAPIPDAHIMRTETEPSAEVVEVARGRLTA